MQKHLKKLLIYGIMKLRKSLKNYENASERVSSGQTGIQNKAKTEDARNRQSTSGTDVRTEEGSNGNSISNIGNGSEISENEINSDIEY